MIENLPFAVPPDLDPILARVKSYWDGLKRGQAEMPFGDDIRLGALEALASHLLLVDCMQRPLRFRVANAGTAAAAHYALGIEGRFADEIAAQGVRDYLLAQCSATVEGRSPTYFRNASLQRLLLPAWGDGHINMLLGASI